MDFSGRVVVITGAAGGAGRAAAQAFAARGAALALVGTDVAKLTALAGELNLPPERVLTHAADLRTAAGAHSAASAVSAHFHRADFLFHLVGGWAGGHTLPETPPEELESMLQQHVWTTFYIAQAFSPLLAASGQGRFIIVSSPVAARPTAKSAAYAAAKAAEEALTLTLAQELKEAGVTANILQVRTIDVEHKRQTAPAKENATWTTPEELAEAMLFLCSPEGGRITGARLPLYATPG